MKWSTEQVSWLVKVLQPERTAMLGLDASTYAAEHARQVQDAKGAAHALLQDAAVAAMVDRLPLKKGAKVVAFGDSHTADPQSWAVILRELLAARRPDDGLEVIVNAVAGEASTHGLVRIGEVVAAQPDWVLFFMGVNDARTQGPNAGKTLVHHEETARNLAELQRRVSKETKARSVWISPAPVLAERVERHWALSRFGVHFRADDVARVAELIRALDTPHVDLFSLLREPSEFLTDDGLHFTLSGQQRIALEIVRGWSAAT